MKKDQSNPPSRIAYIVYHNPGEARKLVEKFGYEAPVETHALVGAVKQLIKRKGEPFTRELLAIHPDRAALLEATGHREESNFCGCQHSSFDPELEDLSLKELKEVYEQAKARSQRDPEDKTLMEKVESVWDLLRQKKWEAAKKTGMENGVLYIGLAFLAGILIAKLL